MNLNSVKTNALLNFVKTFMSLVFPVITFAYASRILLVEGIGQINFSKNIVQYFSMFATLGTTTYGIREGARIRDNKLKLSKFVHEIFFINIITILISYIAFFFALRHLHKLDAYINLLLINGITILATPLGVEWFYGAIENYKYITYRSIIFQIISLVLMISLVKTKEDIYIYAGITVFSSVGSNVLNFFHLKKYIIIKPIGNYHITRHIKPLLVFFASTVSSSIYLMLDTTMLGILTDDTSVGLYSAANKMTKVITSVIVSIGAVLLPRASYYIKDGNLKSYNLILDKAFHVILMITLPTFIIMFFFSSHILMLFSGHAFIDANSTAKWLSCIIVLIPYSTLFSNMIFFPLGKEKYQLTTTILGAATNFFSNYFLIPRFADKGAAVGTVIAETCVLISSIILANRSYKFREVFTSFRNYLIGALLMCICIYNLNHLFSSSLLKLFISGGSSMLVYFSVLFILKDQYLKEIVADMSKLISKKLSRSNI